MNAKNWLLGMAWTVPVSLGWSQTSPQTPDTVPVSPSNTTSESGLWEGAVERMAHSAAAPFDTDEVPLPVEAQVLPDAGGDRLVKPASGNPFFLGFAAGAYYPPAGEKLDPALVAQLRTHFADGRPNAEVFAFAMFEKRITPERVQELERSGARVLGFHPHYSLRVAIPTAAVESVAALPFVRWVGVAREWQKVHPRLTQELAGAAANEPLDVYISLFDSDLNEQSSEARVGSFAVNDGGVVMETADPEALGRRLQSNGWQQRSLESVGVEVLEYVDGIHAFKARMYPASLAHIVAQDNVQFVESDVRDVLFHDESTPLVAGDWGRDTYDGSWSGAVTAGLIDSGFESDHKGLNHVNGFGWDYTGSAGGAWSDVCGHGSHVSGTLLGLPTPANAGYMGMAPGLGTAKTLRLFNVKRFDDDCDAASADHSTLYSHMRSDRTDGDGNLSPRPQVVNCSWGAPGIGWIGSEANARTLDTEVWNYQQMYIFGSGNGGPSSSSIGLPGVAKNAFTVGNVVDFDSNVGDPGTLWTGSSRGPAGDGRWKPNVVAPGRWIRSVDSSTSNGYLDRSGSSTAAPHVTGFVAQLTDNLSWLRYKPHRIASAIMTTAITKNDEALGSPSATHLDQYGAGRIDAYSGHSTNWQSAEFLHPGDSSYFYADFDVPSNTQRLIVCMAYHERSASAGASKALVNDLDLWLDPHPVDPGGNTGQFWSHQSSINNTEIRYLDNPQTGMWRWKVYPDSVTESTRVSVTYLTISRDTTPTGTLTLSKDKSCVQPNQTVEIEAELYNPGFVGSAVYLDTTASGATFQSSSTELFDGVVTDLMTNQQSGRDVVLGNIPSGYTRSAKWDVSWAAQGEKTFSVNARSDNMTNLQRDITVIVDGTPPGVATNVQSTSHTPGVWSKNRDVTFTWTPAFDALSGLDGYSVSTSTGAPQLPDQTKDIEEVVTHEVSFFTSNDPHYFSLRSVDECGNWDAQAASDGGYLIDTNTPTTPTNLSSPTHQPKQSSCDKQITMQWVGATDNHSGLAGYRYEFTTKSDTVPTGSLNVGPGQTSVTANLANGSWYFHLRAKDVAGNWGKTAHIGPYVIDTNPVSTYCTAKKSSCGTFPAIGYSGLPKASATNGFIIRCIGAKAGKAGLLVYTTAGPDAIPFQGGLLCVKPSPLKRTVSVWDATGTGQNCDGRLELDMAAFAAGLLGGNPLPALRHPGQRINCQWWARDSVSNGSLLSNALEYTVCP